MSDPTDMPPRDVATLLAIMRALRDRDSGCPWDIEQTFETIAPYTIEEAYEVAEAIANEDHSELRDELGDLLLQVVYHAEMASEIGAFSFADVVEAISIKMIRRHPHVFGDEAVRGVKPEKGFWETAKAAERASRSGSEAKGLLDDIPLALPALSRAAKLQKRAARVNFDWPDTAGMLDKITEETAEILDARENGTQDQIAGEIGDLLFVLANFARHCGVDPETSLRTANAKFQRRFAFIEDSLGAKGKSLQDASTAEMEALWQRAKLNETAESV